MRTYKKIDVTIKMCLGLQDFSRPPVGVKHFVVLKLEFGKTAIFGTDYNKIMYYYYKVVHDSTRLSMA
jgi:hypothetical protein